MPDADDQLFAAFLRSIVLIFLPYGLNALLIPRQNKAVDTNLFAIQCDGTSVIAICIG